MKKKQEGLPWLLFSVEGRIPRRKYWLGLVFMWGLFIAGGTLGYAMTGSDDGYGLGAVFALWPAIAVNAKRLHDHNASGWWQTLFFIPFVGPIAAIIVQGMIAGKPTANRFGKVF